MAVTAASLTLAAAVSHAAPLSTAAAVEEAPSGSAAQPAGPSPSPSEVEEEAEGPGEGPGGTVADAHPAASATSAFPHPLSLLDAPRSLRELEATTSGGGGGGGVIDYSYERWGGGSGQAALTAAAGLRAVSIEEVR